MTYVGQPSDGEKLQVDQVVFEFDSNNSVAANSIQVGIADTADNTWKKLKDKVNETVSSVNSVIDPTTDKVYVEAKDIGPAGNMVTFSRLVGTSFTVNGASKLGGTVSGNAKQVYLSRSAPLALFSSSPTGKFYDSPTGGFPVTTANMITGDSTFGVYYSDTSTGTHTITVSYLENSVSWISDTYQVVVKDPNVLLDTQPLILTTGISEGVPMTLKLGNAAGNPVAVPAGMTYGITLNGTSSGAMFSTLKSSGYASSISVPFGPGETEKTFYYKDSVPSTYAFSGQSQTQLTATLDQFPAHSSSGRVTVVGYEDPSAVNNYIHIRSHNRKQFNIESGRNRIGDWISAKANSVNVIYNYAGLTVLVPGETISPLSLRGKTGTVTRQRVGVPFTVRVQAISDKKTAVNGIYNPIELTSNAPGFVPVYVNLNDGSADIPITLDSVDPIGWVFTARDLTKQSYANRFAFATPQQTIRTNSVSNVITVRLEDLIGMPKSIIGAPLQLYVTTSSPTGQFSTG